MGAEGAKLGNVLGYLLPAMKPLPGTKSANSEYHRKTARQGGFFVSGRKHTR